jgi:hypothetical protein
VFLSSIHHCLLPFLVYYSFAVQPRFHYLAPFMIRRMAGKISAHIHHHHHPQQHQQLHGDEDYMGMNLDAGIPSQGSAYASTGYSDPSMGLSALSSLDHRESISTDRTDTSQAESEGRFIQAPRFSARPQRPKGAYKLNDFNILRTLGTGSFGRVHLGKFRANVSVQPLLTVPNQFEVNTTSGSTLSRF